jgi:hypothetical protein
MKLSFVLCASIVLHSSGAFKEDTECGAIQIVCRGATLHLNRPEFDEALTYLCLKSTHITDADRHKLDGNGNLKPALLVFDFSLMTQKELAEHIQEIEKNEKTLTANDFHFLK